MCASFLGCARVSTLLLLSRTGPVGPFRERPRGRGRLSAPRVTRAAPTRIIARPEVAEPHTGRAPDLDSLIRRPHRLQASAMRRLRLSLSRAIAAYATSVARTVRSAGIVVITAIRDNNSYNTRCKYYVRV